MYGQGGTRTRYALAVRFSEPQAGVSASYGWRRLPAMDDPIALAQVLRRQGRLLDRIGGSGLLLRISNQDGGVVVQAILNHRGRTRGLEGPDRVPKTMASDAAMQWFEAAETYAASLDQAPVSAPRTGNGRRALLDLSRLRDLASLAGAALARGLGLGRWGMRGAIVASLAIGVLSLFALGTHLPALDWLMPGPRNGTGFDTGSVGAELAEGGSVSRLQGVAKAFGRRY